MERLGLVLNSADSKHGPRGPGDIRGAGQAHFATSTAPGLVAATLRRFLTDHD